MKILKTILIPFLISVMFTLQGCATLSDFAAKNPIIEQLAINAAVKGIVERGSPSLDLQVKRANEIGRIAEVVLTSLEDTDVPLRIVYNMIKSEVNWQSMTPMDQVLYAQILDQLAMSVKAYVDEKGIDGEATVSIRQALSWTLSSANQYSIYLSR